MKKVVFFLIVSSFLWADNFFIGYDMNFGNKNHIEEYSHFDKTEQYNVYAKTESSSFYENIFVGRNFDIDVHRLQLSLGMNYFQNTLAKADAYSLEGAYLYRLKNYGVNTGPYVKLLHMHNVNIDDDTESFTIEFEDKNAHAVGYRCVFDNRSIDFIFAYEYLTGADFTVENETDKRSYSGKTSFSGGYYKLGIKYDF